MIRTLALLLLGLSIADSAYCCNRCGIFGRNCKYYSSSYVQPAYVQAAAVVQSPDVFIVNNQYPPPLVAQQGQTVYGYQAAASQYFVNPAEVLRQAAALTQAATATAQIGITGFNTTAQTQLQLQASISEPLVRSVAASNVLNAAGLSQPVAQQQSLALRIFQSNGQWKVEQAQADQLTAQVQAATAPQPTPAATSILALKCAKCHGTNLTEPKGGVTIDTGHKLDCNVAWKALRMVKADKMPKDAPLNPSEKAALLDELDALTQLPE